MPAGVTASAPWPRWIGTTPCMSGSGKDQTAHAPSAHWPRACQAAQLESVLSLSPRPRYNNTPGTHPGAMAKSGIHVARSLLIILVRKRGTTNANAACAATPWTTLAVERGGYWGNTTSVRHNFTRVWNKCRCQAELAPARGSFHQADVWRRNRLSVHTVQKRAASVHAADLSAHGGRRMARGGRLAGAHLLVERPFRPRVADVFRVGQSASQRSGRAERPCETSFAETLRERR